ncbi:glucosaminidase domain-containing protein [Paenibacillus sp. HN-1]|nr:glucosaminidase domain-containing protein [Paenibacillus sp. CGMCC 1.18879]MBY9078419.1 glucosaminidase domain-containing protein [Paenibacillus sp. CGMCC 1.18879]MBY9087909.1 glucosaminidase domain-containing protein [Paenibacillus sinensis]
MEPATFIATIAPLAVSDMQRTRVPASLTIAQAALESSWGSSGLAVKANNLFGIKGTGPAGSVTMPTTEYVNGRPITVNAAFRAYHNYGESIADHSSLIVHGVSWDRGKYSGVLGADGRTAAKAIAAAGYATDPKYDELLIQLMDRYNLYSYDEEEEEMSAEDKKRITELENTVKQLNLLIAGLTDSRDTLKNGISEQGNAVKSILARLTAVEDKESVNIPDWAQPAVQAALGAGAIDTPSGGSYDFYRILTVIYRLGLIAPKK